MSYFYLVTEKHSIVYSTTPYDFHDNLVFFLLVVFLSRWFITEGFHFSCRVFDKPIVHNTKELVDMIGSTGPNRFMVDCCNASLKLIDIPLIVSTPRSRELLYITVTMGISEVTIRR